MNFSASPRYPTHAQQAAFIKASTAMMEGLTYVQRYAWFALPATKDKRHRALQQRDREDRGRHRVPRGRLTSAGPPPVTCRRSPSSPRRPRVTFVGVSCANSLTLSHSH